VAAKPFCARDVDRKRYQQDQYRQHARLNMYAVKKHPVERFVNHVQRGQLAPRLGGVVMAVQVQEVAGLVPDVTRAKSEDELPTGQGRPILVDLANLEGVYGAGPVGSPYLYERDDPATLLLGIVMVTLFELVGGFLRVRESSLHRL
jgi:hypothetical protein